MKKLVILSFILSFLFVLSGCQTEDVVDDGIVNDDTIDDMVDDTTLYDETLPEGSTDNLNSTENDALDTDNQDMSALYDQELYVTRLKEIDTNFRTSMDEIGEFDVDTTDEAYLTKRSEYYNTSALAYQTALDEINTLPYNEDYADYHNNVISYYQSGYDINSGLATSYGTFTTLDDETAYRAGMADDDFDISDEVRQSYEDSLLNLGIKYD
jgi:hypothetical protein